jgi:exopolyphosphatase/guanosine-5'-triphosphate,3'-diphosphate pyrophosphatase
MRVAIIDVGSNTVRTLVAEHTGAALRPLREEKHQISLGAEVVRYGRISDEKLHEVTVVAREHARVARLLGVSRLDVLVTAPGRQAGNAGALLHALAGAVGQAARVVSAEEEGRLAYIGARTATALAGRVGVIDIGGGSTELAGGVDPHWPEWLVSVDIGSQVLTARWFDDDAPRRKAVAACAAEVAEALAGVTPPPLDAVLATGGTARALRRVVGTRLLSPDDLEVALRRVACRTPRQCSKDFGLDEGRGRVVLAGTLIAVEVQRILGVPLRVARGGIREGAALELGARSRAA